MKYLPIPTGKHVFIHFDGAIREAIYLSSTLEDSRICGGVTNVRLSFKIAGIEDVFKESGNRTISDIYYSLEDAQDGRNKIEFDDVDIDFYNKFADNFWLNEHCTPIAWIWKETRPETYQICWGKYPTFVFADNKLTIVSKKTGERLNNKNWYKTEQECRANNRAKVVTF